MGVSHDTGAPGGSLNYTTLVILHGYVWHSGESQIVTSTDHRLSSCLVLLSWRNWSANFTKLVTLARKYNTRLILLNRRGYPGSTPYTDEARATLPDRGPDADEEAMEDARRRLQLFLKERAYEILVFLKELVTSDNIPPAQPEKNAGGIVVVGWSYAAVLMTALLEYAPGFPSDDVELGNYVRRVVSFGESLLRL